MTNKLALIFVSTTLAFTSTVLTVSAQSAAAGPVQSQTTGLCLDGGRDGNIYTKSCEGNNAFQSWAINKNGSNWFFKSSGTALCLDSSQAGDVYAKDCKPNNPFQRWEFSSSDGGKYKNEKTGLCLDSDNKGKVYALGCTKDRTGQKWHS
jgi:Ricin-type beta-trefoil lectin domain